MKSKKRKDFERRRNINNNLKEGTKKIAYPKIKVANKEIAKEQEENQERISKSLTIPEADLIKQREQIAANRKRRLEKYGRA